MQFYHNNIPNNDDYINVYITEHTDSHISGIVPEYNNINVFISYNNIKKKKDQRYTKIIPIHKEIICIVEDNEFGPNTISASIYEKNKKKKQIDEKDEYEEYFKKNKHLISVVKKITFDKYNFETVWTDVFHSIDKDRDNINLLDYCITYDVSAYFNGYLDIYDTFKELITPNKEKYIFHFSLISKKGIDIVKEIITKSIIDECDIIYNKESQYTYTSYNDYKQFIQLLKTQCKNEQIKFKII